MKYWQYQVLDFLAVFALYGIGVRGYGGDALLGIYFLICSTASAHFNYQMGFLKATRTKPVNRVLNQVGIGNAFGAAVIQLAMAGHRDFMVSYELPNGRKAKIRVQLTQFNEVTK